MALPQMVPTRHVSLGDALRDFADRLDQAPFLAGKNVSTTMPVTVMVQAASGLVVGAAAHKLGVPLRTHESLGRLHITAEVIASDGSRLEVFAIEKVPTYLRRGSDVTAELAGRDQ